MTDTIDATKKNEGKTPSLEIIEIQKTTFPDVFRVVHGKQILKHVFNKGSRSNSNPRKRKRTEDSEQAKPKQKSKNRNNEKGGTKPWVTTKYKHVYFNKTTGRWKVQIELKGGGVAKYREYLSEEIAAREADVLILGREHGKFPRKVDASLLNFPNMWRTRGGKVELNAENWRREENPELDKLCSPPRIRVKTEPLPSPPPLPPAKAPPPVAVKTEKHFFIPPEPTHSPANSLREIYKRAHIVDCRTDRQERLQYLLWWHSRIGEMEEWFSSRYLREELPFYQEIVDTFENGLPAETTSESSSAERSESSCPSSSPQVNSVASPKTFAVESCYPVKKQRKAESPDIVVTKDGEAVHEGSQSPVIQWSGHFPCCDTGAEMDHIESFRCVKCAEWWHSACLQGEFLWEEKVIVGLRDDNTIFLCPACSEAQGSQISRFRGVTSSNHPNKPWSAHVANASGRIHIGNFEDELQAAIQLNRKCQERGIPLANPILEANQTCVADFISHAKHFASNLKMQVNEPPRDYFKLAGQKLGGLRWRDFKREMSDPLTVSQNYGLEFRFCHFLKSRIEYELKRRERAESRLKRGKSPKLHAMR